MILPNNNNNNIDENDNKIQVKDIITVSKGNTNFNQNAIKLLKSGNDKFLIMTFENIFVTSFNKKDCIFYKFL